MSPKPAIATAIALALVIAAGGWFLRSSSHGSDSPTLTVYAAASLTEPFTEIARAFEQQHGVRVQIEFAGSQELRTRLLHGAPADVFASANAKEMAAVIDAGLVASGTDRVFARNELVIIARGDLHDPLRPPTGWPAFCDLTREGLSLCIADPAVPVGVYTQTMLQAMQADCGPDFAERVHDNVISFELNVKLVLAKVRLGEADAGVVYRSDVQHASENLLVIEPPKGRSPIASYPIAVISTSRRSQLARRFVDYVGSPDGQRVLQHYAFMPGSTE